MRPETRQWETRVRRLATKRSREQEGVCSVEGICLVLVRTANAEPAA
jgi:hypothetical protein